MISFEATAFLFFCWILFVMFIDFSFGKLGEYAMHLLDFLMNREVFHENIVFEQVVAGITTGLGIVLGNWVINSFKYKNLIQDISKVFDLVVSNQIDDLYNIRMACEKIRDRLTTHALTIIGSNNYPNKDIQNLGIQFLTKSNLPPKASDDAIHIAAATIHGLDYLLTWNCKHIANAQIQRKLAEICLDFGYKLPTICTPYELMGD